MSRVRRLVVGAALVAQFGYGSVALGGAAEEETPYRPDRREYAAFRAAYTDILEPNYLPFMVHRVPGDRLTGDDLLLCRWPAQRMPLSVYVARPEIPSSVQNEFSPVKAVRYREAALRALGRWESELEEEVRFVEVDTPAKADIRIRLRPEYAPSPVADKEVLGMASAVLHACRAERWDPEADRREVRYEVPEIDVYLADRHGLLLPDQVELITAHELGHALGMRGHSPHPGDLMYPVVPDRKAAKALSHRDIRSFLTLYRLANGAHYAKVPPGGLPARLPGAPPSGAPDVTAAPHVDAREGFSWQPPAGWGRSETDHGVFAANGPVWDHDASMEIAVWPAPTIEDFHERFVRPLLKGRWLRSRRYSAFHGLRALVVDVEDADANYAEEFTLVEIGDGRTLLVHTRAPVGSKEAWRNWFRRSLATLDIWGAEPDEASAAALSSGG